MNAPSLTRRLLLASRSPRRALLLRDAGFGFERFDPPYADPADPNQAPDAADSADAAALAERLARRKAASVPAEAIPAEAVVLCADTMAVTPDGRLMGTPETADAARAMLEVLVGRSHTIVTGVALRTAADEPDSFSDAATVNLGQIDSAELDRYVASGEWRGKAGGYNLAEGLDAGWPLSIQGDPGTVMGLPMAQLTPRLIALGVVPRVPASADSEAPA